MATKEELLSDVLRLPAEERAKLAQELLLSLEDAPEVDAAAEWVSELETRAREVLSGTAHLEGWTSLRERLVKKLREH